MTISSDKAERLEALFAVLSKSGRQNLVMTIKAAMADGETQIPCDELLALIGDEAAHDDRWKALFSALQPLATKSVKRCDQIDTALLHEVWECYLRELKPDIAAAWLSGKEQKSTVQCSLVETLAAKRQSKDGLPRLETRFGAGCALQIDMLVSLLQRSGELEDFFSGWPGQIKNLDDSHLSALREFNDHLIVQSPEITPYLLFLAKTRLKHPYQIFRAVEKVTGHANDRIMVQTELKMVGDALLDENDVWLETFQWQKGQACDPAKMIDGLKHFNELTHGWLSEFDIDPSGVWGKRLSAQRARCGKQWDSFMSRILKNIDTVMPRKHGTITGRQTMPDLDRQLGENAISLAQNAVALLREAMPFASQGGFQFSKDKSVQFLEKRLSDQSDDLLSLFVRSDPSDYQKVSAHFAVLVSMTRAFFGDQDADVLARRGAATLAA